MSQVRKHERTQEIPINLDDLRTDVDELAGNLQPRLHRKIVDTPGETPAQASDIIDDLENEFDESSLHLSGIGVLDARRS